MTSLIFTIISLAILFFFFLKNRKRNDQVMAALCLSGMLFFILMFGINILLGPRTCQDGWRSSSIGSRGACSHHGGVEGRVWVLAVSLLSSGGLFFFYISKLTPPYEKGENLESAYVGQLHYFATFERNVNLIHKAIKTQQKITFAYTDKKGRQTDRTVLPYELKMWNRTTYCVGMCYLARDKRTFNVSKMTNVEKLNCPEKTI